MIGDLIAPQFGLHCPLPPTTDNPACPDRTRRPTAVEKANQRALRDSIAADCRRIYAKAPRGVWRPFLG